jgi:lysophospholipase L1-like esterase
MDFDGRCGEDGPMDEVESATRIWGLGGRDVRRAGAWPRSILLAALVAGLPAASASAATIRPLPMVNALDAICRLKSPLPRVRERLHKGQALKIVAFGSSSTEGEGATSPDHSYPARLQAILRARYPGVDIAVVNLGVGGEDTEEMLTRVDRVVAEKPDLILWQLGTNAVLDNLPLAEQHRLMRKGLVRLAATGADIVLIDPQYTPQVIQHRNIGKMVRLIDDVAQERQISVFHRYAAMRYWNVVQRIPFKRFASNDQIHMNDWSYDQLAKLIANAIVNASAPSPPAPMRPISKPGRG